MAEDPNQEIIFRYHKVSKHSVRRSAPGPGYLDWSSDVCSSDLPLYEAIENAVQQIENRVPAALGNNNIMRVMQAHFTLVPLYLLLGRQEQAKLHLNKSELLAMQLKDQKVSQTIPKLQSMLD